MKRVPTTQNPASIARQYRFPIEDLQLRIMRTKQGDPTKGWAIVYVDARSVMDALDHLFPYSWNTEMEILPNVTDREGLKSQVAVTIHVTYRDDADRVQHLSYTDVGVHTDAKNAFSDGLKRAAAQVGIGRFLWKCGEAWTEDIEYKKVNKKNEQKVLAQLIGPFYKKA